MIIGNVSAGADASVWRLVSIRGDMEQIIIGKQSNIQDNSVLHSNQGSDFHAPASLTIGNQVIIGHACVIHGDTIGNLGLIGINPRILDHAVIQPHALIGANSLGPPGEILERRYLWLGLPVRKIHALTQQESAFFEYSADNYVQFKKLYQEYNNA